MIKAKCPYCNETMKAKDWKQGMFDDCIHCGKKYQWKDTYRISHPDYSSKISYDKFSHLLRYDTYQLDCVLRKELNITVSSRWIDNNLLEYYCREYGNVENEYDIVAVFNRINEEREDLCNQLYQRWMTLVR
jgi:hypothetical protein